MVQRSKTRPYVPVDDILGGYYQIYRRLFFMFGIAAVYFLATYLGAPTWLALIVSGLSIGPLFRAEQKYAFNRVEAALSSDEK